MLLLTTQISISGKDTPVTLEEILEQPMGDYSVLSYNGKKNTYSMMVNTRVCTSHDFIYIKTDTNDTLVLTPDQKMYEPAKKEWVPAGNLNKGTYLLLANNNQTKIEEIHTIKDQIASRVCSLTIAETKSFYANNILVHNLGV